MFNLEIKMLNIITATGMAWFGTSVLWLTVTPFCLRNIFVKTNTLDEYTIRLKKDAFSPLNDKQDKDALRFEMT